MCLLLGPLSPLRPSIPRPFYSPLSLLQLSVVPSMALCSLYGLLSPLSHLSPLPHLFSLLPLPSAEAPRPHSSQSVFDLRVGEITRKTGSKIANKQKTLFCFAKHVSSNSLHNHYQFCISDNHDYQFMRNRLQ